VDPYVTLNVAENADDAVIRRAYLDAVREFPPDLHPERFRRISKAYESIKTEKQRAEFELFDVESEFDSPFDAFFERSARATQRKPPSFDTLKEYLTRCLNQST
jgi:DnaJ-class molecular chaperone